MLTVETPFERASPQVASWVDQLNAMSKEFKSGTVNAAKWQAFLVQRFSLIPSGLPCRTDSGGIRFNDLTFIEITFQDLPCFQEQNRHDWRGCRFLKCDFTGFQVAKFDLRGAEFVECSGPFNLHGANLNDCQLKNCNLSGCNLSSSKLVRVRVFGCDLRQAKVDDAS